MRFLRDTPSINTEIKENPDPAIATLLTRHLQFGAEFNPDDAADLLTVKTRCRPSTPRWTVAS